MTRALPFLTPQTTSSNMVWPGVTYPWMAWKGFQMSPPVFGQTLCIGAECWSYARLSRRDAQEVVQALKRRSWPLETVCRSAAALYAKGYRAQARAIVAINGPAFGGVDRIRNQIRAVYGI